MRGSVGKLFIIPPSAYNCPFNSTGLKTGGSAAEANKGRINSPDEKNFWFPSWRFVATTCNFFSNASKESSGKKPLKIVIYLSVSIKPALAIVQKLYLNNGVSLKNTNMSSTLLSFAYKAPTKAPTLLPVISIRWNS